MAIFDLGNSFGSDSEEMAKARPINERLVGTYVDDLIGVRTDRAEFERVLSALKSDAELRTLSCCRSRGHVPKLIASAPRTPLG
jgi:hypothetical protein